MKKIIPILILTHLLCILLGFWLGVNLAEQNAVPEATIPTVAEIQETEEVTSPVETTEQTLPTEETTVATEEPEETTEATEAQDDPVYIPVVTTPPATQPPATEPPSTQPPITEAPNPGYSGSIGGDANFGGGEEEG